LDALCEEEDAQKKFERAQEEKRKRLKKIEMHEQAARILKEVNRVPYSMHGPTQCTHKNIIKFLKYGIRF
jgi:hypothetical protein